MCLSVGHGDMNGSVVNEWPFAKVPIASNHGLSLLAKILGFNLKSSRWFYIQRLLAKALLVARLAQPS